MTCRPWGPNSQARTLSHLQWETRWVRLFSSILLNFPSFLHHRLIFPWKEQEEEESSLVVETLQQGWGDSGLSQDYLHILYWTGTGQKQPKEQHKDRLTWISEPAPSAAQTVQHSHSTVALPRTEKVLSTFFSTAPNYARKTAFLFSNRAIIYGSYRIAPLWKGEDRGGTRLNTFVFQLSPKMEALQWGLWSNQLPTIALEEHKDQWQGRVRAPF